MVDRHTWHRVNDGVWGMAPDPKGDWVLYADYHRLEFMGDKLMLDTGKGCSVCGHTPVVNIPGGSGTYWLCGDCVAERLEERDSALSKLDAARKAAGMFASVIKSGESWTEHCQAAFDQAFQEALK